MDKDRLEMDGKARHGWTNDLEQLREDRSNDDVLRADIVGAMSG